MSFGIGGSHASSSLDISSLINQIYSQMVNSSQQTSGSATSAGTTTGTTSGTTSGTQQRILSPEQQASQENIARIIKQISDNPQAFLAPAQNQAREQVNANYGGLADSLRQQFMSGGGGQSGKYGTAALKADLARRGQLSNVDSTFGTQAAFLPLTAAQLSQNLLNTNLGETSTGSTAGTTTGTTSGTTTNQQQSTGQQQTAGSSTQTQNTQEKGSQTGFNGKIGF